VELADSAEDVRNLLAALYDSKRFLAFAEVPPPLIMSLIRLGHNYEIDEIRDFALLELQKLYPAAFNAWTRKITCAPAYAIPAVNLARLTEEHSILPLALYDCSARLDVYALLAGTSRADGTIDKLSDEDIIRCLQGKELLRKHLIDATTRFFGMSPCAECESKGACTKELRKLPQKAHNTGLLWSHEILFDNAEQRLSLLESLCGECEHMIDEEVMNIRREIWIKLPTYMDVEVESPHVKYALNGFVASPPYHTRM